MSVNQQSIFWAGESIVSAGPQGAFVDNLLSNPSLLMVFRI
jgi:hypothetical protein